MDKEQAKEEKKKIKEMYKAKKKKKKEDVKNEDQDKILVPKKTDSRKMVKIKGSEVDLKSVGKQYSEKAYTIQAINQIVEICNRAILGQKDIPQDPVINLMLEDLEQIANSDSWYYNNKVKALGLNPEQVDQNDTLNPIEKGLIFSHVKTFLARSKGSNIWGEMQWKYSRSNAESLLLMIANGIEEREILTIEIGINEKDQVVEARINYGENPIDTSEMKVEDIARRFFPNRKWQWKKYDEDLNSINTTNDLSYIIPPQKDWAKAD